MEADIEDASWTTGVRFQRPLQEFEVVCEVDRDKYNARELPERAKQLADERWDKILAENPRVFNALKFRLGLMEDMESDRKDTSLKLRLGFGITDYKGYLTTNRATDPEMISFLEDANLAHVLGVGAMMITVDGFVVYHRRSFHLSEFRGWWDHPGGHPEPSNAKITLQSNTNAEEEAQAARKELFQSILDEMHEEVNIPFEKMRGPWLVGIVKFRTARDKPCAAFLIPVLMTAEEIAAGAFHGTEADESSSLAFVKVDTILRGEGEIAKVILPPGVAAESAAKLDTPKTWQEIKNRLVPTAAFLEAAFRELDLAQFAKSAFDDELQVGKTLSPKAKTPLPQILLCHTNPQ